MKSMNEMNLFYKLAKFICKHRWLYYLLNYTWGLFLTLIGWITLFFLLITDKVYRNQDNDYFGKMIYLTRKKHDWAFSIGTIVICGNLRVINNSWCYSEDEVNLSIVQHEIGHSIQNAIFGPFMVFIVNIPSMIRYWYRSTFPQKAKGGYYDIWFEKSASIAGIYWKAKWTDII